MSIKIPKCWVIDWETRGIEPLPEYPPKPTGVAIREPSGKSYYMCFDHPRGENNCTRKDVEQKLKYIKSRPEPKLYHNS